MSEGRRPDSTLGAAAGLACFLFHQAPGSSPQRPPCMLLCCVLCFLLLDWGRRLPAPGKGQLLQLLCLLRSPTLGHCSKDTLWNTPHACKRAVISPILKSLSSAPTFPSSHHCLLFHRKTLIDEPSSSLQLGFPPSFLNPLQPGLCLFNSTETILIKGVITTVLPEPTIASQP